MIVTRESQKISRERFAKKIHWPFIIWSMGIINAFALFPQVLDVIQTHRVEGISLTTFVIVFGIQVAFSLDGFFKRNFVLLVSNGSAACINALLISLVIHYRN